MSDTIRFSLNQLMRASNTQKALIREETLPETLILGAPNLKIIRLCLIMKQMFSIEPQTNNLNMS